MSILPTVEIFGLVRLFSFDANLWFDRFWEKLCDDSPLPKKNLLPVQNELMYR
jgi:hypothetical protein